MNRHDLPDLEQFLVCCFNQDWMDDYPSAEAAVEAFNGGFGAARIDAAATQLDCLLCRIYGDDEVDALIDELGCYKVPSADGLEMQKWLTAVRERLQSASSRSKDRS